LPNLRLSEADRERLGAPELLPFSVGDITLREAIEIAKLGYKTPILFRQALFNREETDLIAWSVAVWLALRRAGVEVDPQTFDFNFDLLGYLPDPAPVEPAAPPAESPGKARRPSKRSTTATSSSGATSRARQPNTSSPS
jgi:hypothetical protein